MVCGAVRRGGAVGTSRMYPRTRWCSAKTAGSGTTLNLRKESFDLSAVTLDSQCYLRPTKGPVCAGPDSAYSLDCIGPNRSVPDGLCLGPDRMRATVQ